MNRVPSSALPSSCDCCAEGRDTTTLASLHQSLLPDNPRIRVLPERVERPGADPARLGVHIS